VGRRMLEPLLLSRRILQPLLAGRRFYADGQLLINLLMGRRFLEALLLRQLVEPLPERRGFVNCQECIATMATADVPLAMQDN
jgi:hypothetical protein